MSSKTTSSTTCWLNSLFQVGASMHTLYTTHNDNNNNNDNNSSYNSSQQRHLDHNHRYDEDDDDNSKWGHTTTTTTTRHDYNQTIITSTVTIRVTPRDDFLVSWGLLCALLLLAIGWACYQVYKERNIDQPVHHHHSNSSGTTPLVKKRGASGGYSTSRGGGGGGGGSGSGDLDRIGESSSTAEVTRCVFRRLLLFAMLSRFICIPIMIWSDPIWCQFVGDTLPEMVFATAWTLLVTFFVQVVGIATGTGTNTTPSIVIQSTAYVVYVGLILLELVNAVASVLLYALLCCIYAALLGTIVYFLPRLLSLLRLKSASGNSPTNNNNSNSNNHPASIAAAAATNALAWRLIMCTVICALLFSAQMVGFARIVVDPPQKVYWWFKYGCLEVVPSLLFLFMLRPSAHHKDRVSQMAGGGDWKKGTTTGLVRVDSVGSSHSNSPHHSHGKHMVVAATAAATTTSGGAMKTNPNESSALSKSPPTALYGATSNV